MSEFLGYVYIGRRACGRVAATAWADSWPKEERWTELQKWPEVGLKIELVKHHHDDPTPEWVCPKDHPCTCREEGSTYAS